MHCYPGGLSGGPRAGVPVEHCGEEFHHMKPKCGRKRGARLDAKGRMGAGKALGRAIWKAKGVENIDNG